MITHNNILMNKYNFVHLNNLSRFYGYSLNIFYFLFFSIYPFMKTKKEFSSVLPSRSRSRLRQFTLYKNGLMTKNGYYLNFHVLLCNIIQKRNRHVSIPEMCWRQKRSKTSIMRLRSKIMNMKICLLHRNCMIIIFESDCIK